MDMYQKCARVPDHLVQNLGTFMDDGVVDHADACSRTPSIGLNGADLLFADVLVGSMKVRPT